MQQHETDTASYSFTFKCTKCGECCREQGFVFFLRDDIRRAAKHLGMTAERFTNEYLIKTSEGWAVTVMKYKPCTFLSADGCRIHAAKPKQCETFPYWKEYIGKDGKLISFDRPCPGMKIKKSAPKKKS